MCERTRAASWVDGGGTHVEDEQVGVAGEGRDRNLQVLRVAAAPEDVARALTARQGVVNGNAWKSRKEEQRRKNTGARYVTWASSDKGS